MSVFRNIIHVCAEELVYFNQYCGHAVFWTVQVSFAGSDSDFYFLQKVNTGYGTNWASYSGDRVYFPPELLYEADNSHLPTAKDKNK